MGHEAELDIEKVGVFGGLVDLWLVDRLPNLIDISQNIVFGLFVVVSLEVKVSNHEDELFLAGLAEQLEVTLEDDLQESDVRSLVPSQIGVPLVDQEDV